MKEVNISLESINSIEDTAKCKLIIKLTLIDLMHDMNTNLHHKMNFAILLVQISLVLIGGLIPLLFNINTIPISIATAIGTMIMLVLIAIGNILSKKTLEIAYSQREFIEACVDKLFAEKE